MNEASGIDRQATPVDGHAADGGMTLQDALAVWRPYWKWLVIGPLLCGAVAAGVTFLMTPVYTATTLFMPPQQNQSAANSALASLGALSGLAVSGTRTPADQYVALLQSATVSNRIVEQFKLSDVYETKFLVDARRRLAQNVRIAVGKKDGLISVEVEDVDPKRSADIANRYVDELRRFSADLAVTEAQQRRIFFERQLRDSSSRLAQAQRSLQATGFNPGALKAEPKAAADSFARLKAEATGAEVRLQTLRGSRTESAPEVQQQLATLLALRNQLARIEQPTPPQDGPDFVSNYREFKYQETLFEFYARQFELARVDESREGLLIQVVDPATPPERRTRPRRALVTVGTAAVAFIAIALWSLMHGVLRRSAAPLSPARPG